MNRQSIEALSIVGQARRTHRMMLARQPPCLGAGEPIASGAMKVSEILKVKGSTLFTVTPETMLSDAVIVMAEHDIGSLVVMSRGRLVGMLTFREVLRVLARRQQEHRTGPTPPVAEIVVSEVMDAAPTVAAPDMAVNDLRRLMLENHQRYIPVMEGTVLMGVISFHDVAKAVLEAQSFENRLLKAYIRDWPSDGS
jgi:CBS domain-containing protein